MTPLTASKNLFSPTCPLLVVVVLGSLPGAAWACMPVFHDHEAPVRVEGEAGAVSWQHDIYLEARIDPAVDLGGGFVRQGMLEGNWCFGEASTLVHDCATGEAVAFGGEFNRMIPESNRAEAALAELIDERVRAGQPLSIAEISKEAVARAVEFVVPMRTTSTIALGGFEIELGQACRTHYPDLAGTSQ